MGSADVVTLHVQFWFFACGFVAAVGGLLAPRVPPLLLWPFVLLMLVAPRVVGRTLDPQADFLLDYFFALAALLVALWLVDREPWLLAAASAFMGAALLTKRDGQLLVACIVVAALVGSLRQWRYAWPRLALAAAVAAAMAIPWRLWFSSRDLTGELPSAGLFAVFDHPDRGWPAFESAIGAALDYDIWLVGIPLVGVAVFLAFLAGARALPGYALTLYVLTIAGLTWVLWSFTELELPFTQDEGVNPIVRLSGLTRRGVGRAGAVAARRRMARCARTLGRAHVTRLAPWLLVAALALVYPIVTLATGDTTFPERDDCVHAATEDGEIDAVFGYFDNEGEAVELRDRALEVGFPGTEATWNGCGRVRVALGGIPTLEVGREFAEQARAVGFEVTLERAQ